MTAPKKRSDCPQPLSDVPCEQRHKVKGGPDAYCLCDVYEGAKRRCVDKGEGWRWGQ